MSNVANGSNEDKKTVEGFGQEWVAFDQTDLPPAEQLDLFNTYFSVFPWGKVGKDAVGFDMGCGSGRWAELAADRVGHLHCIDAANDALDVARRRLAHKSNVSFHHASVGGPPIEDGSQDFGFSLGVLHHVPDTQAAIAVCAQKLKVGAPFLIYLYYRFDDKPAWFVALWRVSELMRHAISRLPFGLRKLVTTLIAVVAYWPLARAAGLAEKLGANVTNWPLSGYRTRSFYTMRTDALDRFGTALEQRFTKAEIKAMLEHAGFIDIRFRDSLPFWVAVGTRA